MKTRGRKTKALGIKRSVSEGLHSFPSCTCLSFPRPTFPTDDLEISASPQLPEIQ